MIMSLCFEQGKNACSLLCWVEVDGLNTVVVVGFPCCALFLCFVSKLLVQMYAEEYLEEAARSDYQKDFSWAFNAKHFGWMGSKMWYTSLVRRRALYLLRLFL